MSYSSSYPAYKKLSRIQFEPPTVRLRSDLILSVICFWFSWTTPQDEVRGRASFWPKRSRFTIQHRKRTGFVEKERAKRCCPIRSPVAGFENARTVRHVWAREPVGVMRMLEVGSRHQEPPGRPHFLVDWSLGKGQRHEGFSGSRNRENSSLRGGNSEDSRLLLPRCTFGEHAMGGE